MKAKRMTSETHRLTIDRLSYGPNGVGRLDGESRGKVVFVPAAVPGDDLDIALTDEKKRYATGRIVTVRHPSAERRVPPCPHLPDCGGCPWQQVSYAEQLRAKEAIVRESLRRIGGVSEPTLLPIVPSPQEWRYRHRIRLRTEPEARLGFYRSDSHTLVELDDCLIAAPASARHLARARAWLGRLRTCVRRVELLTGDPACGPADQVVLAGNAEGRFNDADEKTCAAFVRECDDVAGLLLFGRGWRRSWGDPRIVLNLGVDGLRLEVSRGGFTQVNPAANRVLIEHLLRLAEFERSQRVIECYAGAGNLTLPIAARAGRLVAIERDANAIADARENLARLGFDHVECLHASAKAGLRRLVERGETADVLVVDPPRAGMADMLDEVSRLHVETLVYVSCDPTTLARDLRRLRDLGYGLRCAQPIDLFPHTYHVETIAIAVLTC